MSPIERKRILRLATALPRAPRSKIPLDPDAPDKLVLAITEYGDKRANDAVFHYATQRSWKVRFMAWWDGLVSGPNAGKGGPA